MTFIRLNEVDSVAVALEAMAQGDAVSMDEQVFTLLDDVPAGHKFALRPIASGDAVIKYGAPIGISTSSISPGQHVHVHNMKTGLDGISEYKYTPPACNQNKKATNELFFDGYRRTGGKVGIRNEVWILSTVGCVSHLAQKIAWKANELYGQSCDGVFAFTHPFGCSQTGDDLENTRYLLSSLAQHPNAGAILIVGLGCENNQGSALLETIPSARRERIRFFNCQETDSELDEGVRHIKELVDIIANDQRTPCPLSDLTIGMKCGGSDGFSGLSANPLVGRISDAVFSAGGSVLLTETPEMFGAEQILMNRAVSETVFSEIVKLVNKFKQYFIDNGQNIYENPSPGNKQGGITTLEEKSMGAIQKGGIAKVTDVLQYAQLATTKGLSLIEGPGNDAVSSTALTASGAVLILFTTGRGTPLGFPAPTMKIASNSRLAKSKPNWIDFDAGRVFENNDLNLVSEELLSQIIAVASGQQKTKSEINDQREIAIWKNGVTL